MQEQVSALPFRTPPLSERTSLELRGKDVNDDRLAKLFGYKKLRELHIVEAKQVTDTGLTFIENLHNLEWLNLDGVAVTDKGLFFVQNMKQLKGLQLTNAFLNGSGLGHLLALKHLEYLCLCGTAVDDAGVKVLAKLKKLRTLRLSSTEVTDKGIRKLQSHAKLRTLVLRDSKVSAECVEKLRQHMPKCEIIWSPYSPPKPVPSNSKESDYPFWPNNRMTLRRKSPPVQDLRYPFPAQNLSGRGWYLYFICDQHRLKIERQILSGGHGSNTLRITDFKVSQPQWLELLDWKSEVDTEGLALE